MANHVYRGEIALKGTPIRPGSTHDAHSGRPLQVAFVDMPFASSRRPSIQLGLLQAILAREGMPARTLYLNLELAAVLGWETYESLCHTRDILLGEWLFAVGAFGDEAPEPASFVAHHERELQAACAELNCDIDDLVDLRTRVLPDFIDDCVNRFDWSSVDVVAFSSIFEQNCAALALARRLKERKPKLITIFGGANFEDEMGVEYVRGLPWIDYAVIGEGDEVLPSLLKRLTNGEDTKELLGVATRARDGSISYLGRAPQVESLDGLPEPDYTDYFDAAARLGVPAVVRGQVVGLPFETARGCWWGVKRHCTFCGLNGLGMAFRSKSAPRVLQGIEELARRHETRAFLSVDNILDQHYIADVFGPLARQRMDYTFFFEVKANLKPDQLRALAEGGVRTIQPGIESLSTRILELMRKGTTSLQNVRFLKWGRYYGLNVTWNLLLGFPGERVEDYDRQVKIIRSIPHLWPPGYVGRIRLDRFSPNFVDSEDMGFRAVSPIAAYSDTYPALLDHRAIAYFFSYDAPDTLSDDAYTEVVSVVRQWQAAWESSGPPYLVFQRGAGRLTVTDGRSGSTPRVSTFGELEAKVYEACSITAHSAARVATLLEERGGVSTSTATVEAILEDFTSAGLMLDEDGHYLALALPVNRNW
jgi:ribosomal peptide maturation radical SAM protein 1